MQKKFVLNAFDDFLNVTFWIIQKCMLRTLNGKVKISGEFFQRNNIITINYFIRVFQ